MLEAEGLVKTYGSRRVVDGVDFEVSAGEIVGLLGPNGAGKTTCFRMTCGMIEPNAGTVRLSGVEVTAWPMYRRARDGGMGYLAQESSVFRKLSVQDNLLGVMELLGIGRKARRLRCNELLEQFNIAHLRKALAISLSGGERRRLEIARALCTEPQFLLLDEPFTGLDPLSVGEVQKLLRPLAHERGIGLLLTDHAARELFELCDRIYLMHDGELACEGSAAEVAASPFAREVYLGESFRLG